METKWLELRRLYDALVDELSLAQYRHLMGGEMSYESKARRALKVSRSKQVHYLCNAILFLAVGETKGLDALQIANLKGRN
jgi:hypothetical protein